MADFTLIKTQTNAGAAVTDASPTWVDMPFGTANNELRLCGTGAGTTTTASASWPTFLRPGATAVWPEAWAYTADAVGLQMKTYDGTSAHYMQWRINWDNTGTFASAPIISAWGDNTLAAASPGTQPGAQSGSPFVNGHATDTSSTSYIKGNAYGRGTAASGSVQDTPAANAAGTMAVTTGTAGAVSPGSAAWLATWQSLQALTQYIQDSVTPQAVFAGFWYVVLAFFTGPNQSGGTLLPVLGFQYTWV
jgi:hypothetical protein